MSTALGFDPTSVYITGLVQEAAQTRCHLIAQDLDGARLYLYIDAHEAICVLGSDLKEADATWPPLFHRLAAFGPDGPTVSLRLDTAPPEADMAATPWAALEQVASEDERAGLEELLGLATLAAELVLDDADEPASQLILSSLRSRGVVVARDATLPMVHDDNGKGPLTALRTSIAEYYTSSGWEHIRIQLDGSVVAGVPRDILTFKVFRRPTSIGLEFRPDPDTGAHPFRTFPGSERDEFGPFYMVSVDMLSGELILPEVETITPQDLAFLDTVVEALYPTMRHATLAIGHLDERTYAGWTGTGAALTAAYKAARKSG